MMTSNKILTVSYGTFSCTLEGFDDSFGMMKSIAEYFQDLTANDRYFGAEPAKPDPQMLAKIAEKEALSGVEARMHEGKIVLSSREQIPPATAAGPAGAVAPETQKRRAHPHDRSEARRTGSAQTTVVPSLPDDEVEAFFADSPSPILGDEDGDIGFAEAPAAPISNIAGKLKRMRAALSQHGKADETPEYSEDQHATAGASTTPEDSMDAPSLIPESDDSAIDDPASDNTSGTDMLEDTVSDIENALDADDAAETSGENDGNDLAVMLGRLNRRQDGGGTGDTNASVEHDRAGTEEDTSEASDAGVLHLVGAINAGHPDAGDFFSETPSSPFEGSVLAAEEDENETAAELPGAGDAFGTGALRAKRSELEAAIAADKTVEDEDMNDDDLVNEEFGSSLSPEDEAELARELAEVESDFNAEEKSQSQHDAVAEPAHLKSAQDDDDETNRVAAVRASDAGHRSLPEIDEDQDADISRLMAETESQMDEPGSATRRDAFAQFRAAVAAKKADDENGKNHSTASDEDQAYRADLADVVRPRRHTSDAATRTARPEGSRPAPLKLVAEQRIDVAVPRPEGPVRPRRAAFAADTAPVSENGSFADFMAELGATELPDLLEAAAAYMSFVEGRKDFTRSQLMSKVRQVAKEVFSRDDGLRSFGELLRDGKIEKVCGGRFQASEQIGYRPDARAAS